MTSPLAQTDPGIAWLKQFEDNDKPTAELLLKCLRFVADDEFDRELSFLVDRAQQETEGQLALYAVREPRGHEYFYNKVRRPDSIDATKPAGSEAAAVGRIGLIQREAPTRYLDHPALVTLKKRRCRHIALIDDIVGSGKRVVNFLSWMLNHKSLRSWRSLGWIRFSVISYAATDDGIRRVIDRFKGNRADLGIDFRHSERLAVGDSLFNRADRAAIEELCIRYGKLHRIRWQYLLGYRNVLSTMVFAHGCPNNAPGILWEKTKTWTPLFPSRTVTPPIKVAMATAPKLETQSDILASFEARDIARHHWFQGGSEEDRRLLLVLVAISKKIRSVPKICKAADLPRSAVEHTLSLAENFGLIDQTLHLTSSGVHGLSLATQTATISEESRLNDFYYPALVKGGRAYI